MNPDTAVEVGKVLNSGMVTQASKVVEYEERLATYFNHPYVISLNSATSGLTLAYMLLNLSPDDEVITTPLTCFATTAAILANKCRIVWADVDQDTCNIDLNDVKQKITKNTKALCFVHWGGTPVNLDRVEEIKQYALDKYNIKLAVIEDCAHAFGAKYDGFALGTKYGNIAVYSTQAIKHLTTADGGIMMLPTKEFYDRAMLLRWYGIDRNRRSLPGSDFRLEPDIPQAGGKYHMNDVNATIGLCNLVGIQERLDKYRERALYYTKNIQVNDVIQLLHTDPKAVSAYWIYTLKVGLGLKQEFMQYMTDHGVVVSQVHARNDKHTCVSQFQTKLPKLDALEKQIISIPVGWWVDFDDINIITSLINDFSRTHVPNIVNLSPDTVSDYRDILTEMNGYVSTTYNIDQSLYNSVYLMYINSVLVASGKLLVEQKLYRGVGHIEDIVVKQSYRGQGVGKYLVNWLRNLSHESFDCYKTVLSCKQELHDFYTNAGFTYEGVSMVSRYYK